LKNYSRLSDVAQGKMDLEDSIHTLSI